MSRPRKHIDRLDCLDLIVPCGQYGDVAGEGRGVAGDVDDFLGIEDEDFGEHDGLAAFTGRIEDDQGRVVGDLGARDFLDFGGDEGGVGDAVLGGISARVLDCSFIAFDSDELAGVAGEVEAYGAGTAVEVEDRCDGYMICRRHGCHGCGCQVAQGEVAHGVIEPFCLL